MPAAQTAPTSLGNRLEQIRARSKPVQPTEDRCINGSLAFEDEEPQVHLVRSNSARSVGEYLKVKRPIPMWHENERAGPNVLMRSSLFTIAPLNMKRWVATASKPRDIACLGDYQIQMVGEELRQDDGDVFFGVLHLARVQANRGGTVQFVASEFIRDLGWNRDGHTYKRLHEIFRRLASTLLIVSGKNVTGEEIRETGFTMLEYDYARDESNRDGGKWQIRIPSSTVNLFWVSHYSRLHWDLRRNLRSLLARYLHLLYATYRGPLSFGVVQLHTLSGSSQKRMSTFRQALAVAHDELTSAGILARWDWQDKKRTRISAEMSAIGEQHVVAQQQLELLESAL